MGVSNKKIPLPEDQAGVFLIQLDQSGFRVTVQLTMQIPMGIFSHQPTTVEQLATADTVKQCLEIIVKYGLGRTCLSCDTNPQTFFLPVSRMVVVSPAPTASDYQCQCSSFHPDSWCPTSHLTPPHPDASGIHATRTRTNLTAGLEPSGPYRTL